VPKRKTNPTKVRTKIARVRVDSGVTRAELAEATGLGVRNLQELETGWVENPGIHTLTRIAYALDVPIEQICEDKWIAPVWLRRTPGKPKEDWDQVRVRRLVKRRKRPKPEV
jgi:transcriptional regulator with XRE-family HTH domain